MGASLCCASIWGTERSTRQDRRTHLSICNLAAALRTRIRCSRRRAWGVHHGEQHACSRASAPQPLASAYPPGSYGPLESFVPLCLILPHPIAASKTCPWPFAPTMQRARVSPHVTLAGQTTLNVNPPETRGSDGPLLIMLHGR